MNEKKQMRTLGRGSKKNVVRICLEGYLNQLIASKELNSDERSKSGAVRMINELCRSDSHFDPKRLARMLVQ